MNFKFNSSIIERIIINQSIVSLVEKSKYIYFIGISGIGMSALARLFKGIGKIVSGSSDVENDQTKTLQKEGINIFIGHKKENINNYIQLVIKSEAVPENNVEVQFAKLSNVPIISYGEGLSYFFNMFESVAITGTHGKSSVSGILVDALWDTKKISYLVGTNVKKTKTNGKYKGTLFIGEACEYRETFSNFYPDTIIIPSLEVDHIDYYKNKKNYLNAFKDFAFHLKGKSTIIIRASTFEEIELLKFVVSIPFIKNYYFYSDLKKIEKIIKILNKNFNKSVVKKILSHFYFYKYVGIYKSNKEFFLTEIYKADYKKNNIYDHDFNTIKIVELLFPIPTSEYAANITSVFIYFKTLGLTNRKIQRLIKKYNGIERRFDIMGKDERDNIVINDYAHHPSEIKTFLKMVKQKYINKKIISIFQPHQYSRTYYLLKGFVNSFTIPEYVIFLPIYKQRDTKEDIEKVSHKMLCDEVLKKRGNVYCFTREEDLFLFLKKFSKSVILFIGAGSIIDIARKYIKIYKSK